MLPIQKPLGSRIAKTLRVLPTYNISLRAGIWIDSKQAVIVFVEGNSSWFKTIHSKMESRDQISGETNWFTRVGNQFINLKRKRKTAGQMN